MPRYRYKIVFTTLLFLTTAALAQTDAKDTKQAEKFHDADPRNTQTSVGFVANNDGDLKLDLGGGGANLYGGGEYQTQTIFFSEYLTQAESLRIRIANFDERFGGVYADLTYQDIMGMYTFGYMVPMQAIDSKLLFFTSINYTRVEFDTDVAADAIIKENGGPISIHGVEYDSDAISGIIKNLALGGDDSSDLGSLDIYAMMPWNDTHFSLLQVTAGSSYGGFDMQLVDLYFMQGVRANLGKKIHTNVYIEARYTETTIQGIETTDSLVGVGFSLKF